jgi:glycosyltransferase involved in cell wall biosynthesis
MALKRAEVTLAATAQTAAALEKLKVANVQVMPQSGISAAELVFFDEIYQPVPERAARLVSACRHEHWKALHLSIRAVAQICEDHPELRYHILSGGPEQPDLEALVAELGVGEQVRFLGRLPTQEDVFKEMAGARLFLHPALHEAFGQACLEALALGVPVLCMDWGGPGIIVDSASGFAIAPAAEEQVITAMAKVIRRAVEHPEELVEVAQAARVRAREVFAWESLGDKIDEVYQQVGRS